MSDPRLDPAFRDPARRHRSPAATYGLAGLVAAAIIIAIAMFASTGTNQRVASDNARPASEMNAPAQPPATPTR